ncbi:MULTISPECIES: LysR family transcriptional regulator [Variovorax]|jgi:DNA-binding transcriptional LysR family regulator|uniref:LysR family transcriptional regulator n=1 Tax=Variovorax TaxID=34072 RepID=UPI00086F2BCB|nr:MULTISPECIES: LysR family transcriptional regulator [Variovorax]MBN8757038.1 LysR family transcriptional regulator [Variovorax sp.]ODU13827.1 MAG: LysR family transcriptional regulator [Variovorax sp. SCN 67-85]ODV21111.1 MAG: LysR family transcriptional regulator [Variovorax sp. SCN 67-20]OJZ08419.1 MAG: LysR family transcriptional regulator [Variovorax sp. 67-131]UKI10209.1 LysR family transcriptional regulator [Variovorax paradoxus]
MDFDPTLLRAFVAVKETGGFTRAAQRLHLTQSAVSHQIRRLEEQVGRPLLHRTTRRLTVTEDGEDFLRYAQQILDTLDEMTRRFQPSPISGVVRFGAPDNFMGDRLPPLLSQFARAFPATRMEVSVSMHLDLRAMIRAGELDLAVVMSPPDCVEGTRLRRSQLVWVAAETFEPPPGASLPMAFSPKPCVNREVAGAALDAAPFEWHVVFTSVSPHGIRAAVLAGLAVTVLAREDVEPGMKIVDGRYGLPPLPSVDFSLIWSESGRTECACRFGQLILEMPDLPLYEKA